MELLLKRVFRNVNWTLGKLYVNNVYECDTIEDTCRNLRQDMTDEQARKIKVFGKTAIPSGRYRIDMDTVSPKFSKKKFYRDLCQGKLPRLVDVKFFEGILLHCGNSAEDSAGCPIVGEYVENGRLKNSQLTFKKLYAKMKEAYENGEEIWITVS